MGWTGALHLVQHMHEGLVASCLPRGHAGPAKDFCPPPRPEGRCIFALHVDHVIVHGKDTDSVAATLADTRRGFEAEGIELRPTDAAASCYSCLGVEQCGQPPSARVSERRHWEL